MAETRNSEFQSRARNDEFLANARPCCELPGCAHDGVLSWVRSRFIKSAVGGRNASSSSSTMSARGLRAKVLTRSFRRAFTTRAVEGFTGAVGNTPLVSAAELRRCSSGHRGTTILIYIRKRVDTPQEAVGGDRLYYCREGRISESWGQCEG